MDSALGVVDAGFLLRATGTALRLGLAPFDLDPIDVRNWFRHSAARLGHDLLRTYWYDAARALGTDGEAEQRAAFAELEQTPGVQLRLGHLVKRPDSSNSAIKRALRACGVDVDEFKKHYEFRDSFVQKGVDTLIVLDMVRLAQLNAYQTLLMIAGDADLAHAVRAVQETGKSVVIAVPDGIGLSSELRRIADEVVFIRELQLRRMLKAKPGLSSYVSIGKDDA